MSSPTQPNRLIDLLNPRTLPVFLMFFFWGFGTGGLWLVRPLFAYELTESFLAVAVVSAVSAAPRTVVAAAAGYLTDRYGRKPFIVLGAVIHIVALVGQFLSGAYLEFFLLEMLAGVGISTWMTASNALMADETEIASRGRAVALRQTSSRIGLLVGPVMAGLVAATVSLPAVFLYIAACKAAVIVVTVIWIKESHTAETRSAQRAQRAERSGPRRRIDLSVFRTRAFLALAIGTFAVSGVVGGTGVFRTFFPVQGTAAAGLDELQVGNLIAVSGILALVAAIPAGMANDRYGRKRTLIAGLTVMGVAVWLMSGLDSFEAAVLSVLVFGFAEALGSGTVQVYAMDLAPDDRRGAFLGVWSLSQSAGQILGPLAIGLLADQLGFRFAFLTVVALLALGAAMVVVFGAETHAGGKRRSPPAQV